MIRDNKEMWISTYLRIHKYQGILECWTHITRYEASPGNLRKSCSYIDQSIEATGQGLNKNPSVRDKDQE